MHWMQALFGTVLVFAGLIGCSQTAYKTNTSPAQNLASAAAELGPSERIAWDSMPREMYERMLQPGPAFVVSPHLAWDRPVLRIAFENGSPALHALIEQTAQEWIQPGSSIQLSFKDENGTYYRWSSSDTQRRADIRISFRSDPNYGGYWSMVGVLAQNARPSQPTMNLDGFRRKLVPYLSGQNPEGWQQSYYRSTILHEFGHALALSHEHFHPNCQSSLDMDRVVQYLMGSNGWSEATAKFNADAEYYEARMKEISPEADLEFSSGIDRASVMLYSLPEAVIGSSSPCSVSVSGGYATALSDGDINVFHRYYSGN